MNLSIDPTRSLSPAPAIGPALAGTPPARQPALVGDQVALAPAATRKPFISEAQVSFSHSWFMSDLTEAPAKSGWVSRNGIRLEAGHELAAGQRARLLATASVTADKGHLSYLIVPAAGLRGEVKAVGPLTLYGSAAVGASMGQLAGKPTLGPQVHVAAGAGFGPVFAEYGLDRGPGLQGHNIAAGVRFKF